SEIVTWWVLSTHTISDVPPLGSGLAPVKCPTPTKRELAGAVVALSTKPDRLAPFISQISTVPLVFSHSTSERPSWLKSPVPSTFHSVPIWPLEMPKLPSVVPFMVQTAADPASPVSLIQS